MNIELGNLAFRYAIGIRSSYRLLLTRTEPFGLLHLIQEL